MLDTDNKGISQLLLSPLFLFNQILGILTPGAILMLLLVLKGNRLLRNVWLDVPLGYKTKITLYLLLAYVLGQVVKLPVVWFGVFVKTEPLPEPEGILKGQPAELAHMLRTMFTDGVIMATPGLTDRLSLIQADANFHLTTSIALVAAAMIPGDGHLRWLELLIGIAMFGAGIRKTRHYKHQALGLVGVGLAYVIGTMSPEKLKIAAAILKALKVESAPEPEAPAEASGNA
jgi:hypothetical protein